MDQSNEFRRAVDANATAMPRDEHLRDLSQRWLREASRYQYAHSFHWMGRPIIQVPQDLVALQEIIWSVQPERIVETGVAHGGSLVFYASMLQLMGGVGRVVGVEIEMRQHNRCQLEKHPMFHRIDLVEGSSTDPHVVAQVRALVDGHRPVLVSLDSNHSHQHVLDELQLYSPLVTRGSYLIVFDTAIQDVPPGFFANRPWDVGNNPKTAVWEFLKTNDRFEIDRSIQEKFLITTAPDGYLKCLRD